MANCGEVKLCFASDYMEGAHPAVMQRLLETNLEQSPGYGTDAFSEEARQRLRDACGAPNAQVWFLTGGTQTNATVIDALLHCYQGVIAAETGHICAHEAGAVELGGHKVLTLPQTEGKLSAKGIRDYVSAYRNDQNRDHLVMPGMVYLSQPTEYGTLYSLEELTAISRLCRELGLPLYLDGARLAYALACPANDVTLRDIGALCDVFYIGGTKCGALFGEAVVIPEPALLPHFFTIMKQHGALLAKGRLLGLQFGTLFTGGLYERLGAAAISAADRIRAALAEYGYQTCFHSPTNQIFVLLDNVRMAALAKRVEFSFWEQSDSGHTVIRLATSWATREADVDQLIRVLREIR